MGKSPEPVIHDKLFTLDRALDPGEMLEMLRQLALAHLPPGHEIRDLHIEVMRRRNQRCVIRYVLTVTDLRSGRTRPWRLVGKVYKANRGERVFDLMKRLWRNGFSRDFNDGIGMPEPIAFSSQLCLLLQEEVPGVPIKNLLKRDDATPALMRLLARTLAKLHRTPIQHGAPYTIDDHLLRCHPRYPFLCLAYPEIAPQIEAIVQQAKEITALNGDTTLAPIHGDFHLGQVHIEDGRAWLIDYDALCIADPAADIGNLLVFLKGKARRDPRMLLFIEAFLDEYYRLMGEEIAVRVPIYEALTHVRRACKCLRYQQDGWRRKVAKMIDQGVKAISDVPLVTSISISGQNGTPDNQTVGASSQGMNG